MTTRCAIRDTQYVIPMLPETFISELAAIVSDRHLRPATGADAIDGLVPELVVAPGSAEEVARVVQHVSEAGMAILPRGGGTKLGWGNRPSTGQIVLELRRMDRVVEHAWGDMTATVQAG